MSETLRRERLVDRWHKSAHAVLAFPGVAIAYFFGGMSGGHFSVMMVFMIIVGLEALALLIAYVGSRLGHES